MKRKIYKLENLTSKDKIVITSQGFIDFMKEITHIVVYFDDLTIPEYYLYAELQIYENNQKQNTILELSTKGKNIKIATIIIEAITDYNIEKIMVLKKP